MLEDALRVTPVRAREPEDAENNGSADFFGSGRECERSSDANPGRSFILRPPARVAVLKTADAELFTAGRPKTSHYPAD